MESTLVLKKTHTFIQCKKCNTTYSKHELTCHICKKQLSTVSRVLQRFW